MSAILSYERSRNIPEGWINHSISASGTNGSWARLERGEIPLDASFFASFQSDLSNSDRWTSFYASRRPSTSTSTSTPIPPVPHIDAHWLYWEMMRISRHPDPNIYPALRRLRAHADASNDLVIAACSNTSIFPEGHEFNDPSTPEGQFHAELRGNFDVFVSSAHVGRRKPERGMYELALAEVGRLSLIHI